MVWKNSRFVFVVALVVLALGGVFAFPDDTQGQTPDPDTSKLDAALLGVLRVRESTVGPAQEAEAAALRYAEATTSAFEGVDGQVYVEALIKTTGATGGIEDLGVIVQSQVGPVLSVSIPLDVLPLISALPNVEFVEAARRLQYMTDISVPETGGADFHAAGNKGAGVIVAVIDSGIDFMHQDFRKPDGTTRIKFLCDQTDAPQGGDATCPGGNGTSGTLWTEAQINATISGQNIVRQRDLDGHGTHVAGTAAGDDPTFTGMAPEADLLIVKTTLYSNDLVSAIEFVDNRATQLAQPYVLNMSLGSQDGYHDGTDLQSQAIDALVGEGKPGKTVVVAAGNDGAKTIHYEATANGEPHVVDFTMPIPGDSSLLQRAIVNLFYDDAEDFLLSFHDPDGQGIPNIPSNSGSGVVCNLDYCYYYIHTGNQTLTGTKQFQLTIDAPGIWVGGGSSTIQKPGTWRITLDGEVNASGAFDAWCVISCYFPDGDSQFTIGSPGSAKSALAVGSYVTKPCWESFLTSTPSGAFNQYCYVGDLQIGAVSSFSSNGPTKDGRIKPDISAPGQAIISALSRSLSV